MIQVRWVWNRFWRLAGRVPLRQKIIGIVVTSLLILGLSIAWWVRNGLGGWLSYLLSEERVAQAMNVGTRGVVIITILAAILGLVVAWLLTWLLTRPILNIARIAQQVGEGNLDVRAPVWANDEIGQLGYAFNTMISSMAQSQQELKGSNRQLRRRNRELEALYELARLTVESSIQTTLEFGLQSVMKVTRCGSGLIAMFEESGASNIIQATEDITPVIESHASFLQGLYDRVCASGHSQNCQQEHIPDLIQSISACQTCLAMPIRLKETVRGILVVFSEDSGVLLRKHERFLDAISNQIGLALENSQLWEELRHKEATRARLLAKIVGAQEEERKRISRELHDGTGQSLTSMLVQLKVLESLSTVDDMRHAASDLRRLTSHTLEEVRRMALNLRPSTLDDLGLLSALEWHTGAMAKQSDLRIKWDAPKPVDWERLPPNYDIMLYRFVQEALTNAAKHADAERVTVSLRQTDGVVEVRVEDDGCGFEVNQMLASQDRGLGLLGMAERIELIGGTFSIHSNPGSGTCVTARVPAAPSLEGV